MTSYNFVSIAIFFKMIRARTRTHKSTNTQHQCTSPYRPNVLARLHTTSANKSNLLVQSQVYSSGCDC